MSPDCCSASHTQATCSGENVMLFLDGEEHSEDGGEVVSVVIVWVSLLFVFKASGSDSCLDPGECSRCRAVGDGGVIHPGSGN